MRKILFIVTYTAAVLCAQTVKISYEQNASESVQAAANSVAGQLKLTGKTVLIYPNSRIYAKEASLYALKSSLVHLAFTKCEVVVNMGLAENESAMSKQLELYSFVVVSQNGSDCLFTTQNFWDGMDEKTKKSVKKSLERP